MLMVNHLSDKEYHRRGAGRKESYFTGPQNGGGLIICKILPGKIIRRLVEENFPIRRRLTIHVTHHRVL